jgi:hypothetical protein
MRQVRRTPEEALFNSLLQQHHYLGYTQPVGEHLKYLVLAHGRPVACFAWCSAPRHLGSRDRFIGWGQPARLQNIRLLAYNTRFLILPWVTVPHLASHLLGRMARQLSGDWQAMYGHPIYFLETFIEPERFRGTCYRAANWQFLGMTTGRGKDAPTHVANRSLKEVLGYPLVKDFRQRLSRSHEEAARTGQCHARHRSTNCWHSRNRCFRHPAVRAAQPDSRDLCLRHAGPAERQDIADALSQDVVRRAYREQTPDPSPGRPVGRAIRRDGCVRPG